MAEDVLIRFTRGTEAQVLAATNSPSAQPLASTDTNTMFVSDGSVNHMVGRTVVNTFANIPAAGVVGKSFFASDQNTSYIDNGTAWIPNGIKGIDNFSASATAAITIDAVGDTTIHNSLILDTTDAYPGAVSSLYRDVNYGTIINGGWAGVVGNSAILNTSGQLVFHNPINTQTALFSGQIQAKYGLGGDFSILMENGSATGISGIRWNDEVAGFKGYVGHNNDTNIVNLYSSVDLAFYAGTVERMRIATGGDVRINGATNVGALAVKSTTNNNLIIHTVTAGYTTLSAANDANTVNTPMEYRASIHTFSIGAGNFINGLTTTSFNVSTANDAILGVISTGTIQSGVIRVIGRQASVNEEWDIVACGSGLSTTDGLRFVRNGWTGAAVLALTQAGNATFAGEVNIGGTNTLHFAGGTSSTGGVLSTTGANADLNIFYQAKGTASHFFQTSGGLTQFSIAPVTGATSYITAVGSAGNVPYFVPSGGTNPILGLAGGANSGVNIYSNNASTLQLSIGHSAGATNRLHIIGGTSTTGAVISVLGTGANLTIYSQTKGTGSHYFQTSGATSQFRVTHTASAVNILSVTGGATGSPIVIASVGSDTNVDISLVPQGTGVVWLGAHTGNADAAVTGYVLVKDTAGTLRKLAVIA